MFGIPDRVCQFYFCKIMRIEALNVTFVGAGDRFLRLNDFQVIGDTGSKTVFRLGEGSFG